MAKTQWQIQDRDPGDLTQNSERITTPLGSTRRWLSGVCIRRLDAGQGPRRASEHQQERVNNARPAGRFLASSPRPSAHERPPKCPPGGALTPLASDNRARRVSPSPPAGVGVDYSDPGPADRWQAGDLVPGVSSLPGVLKSSDPPQALFSPPCFSPLKILRNSREERHKTPFVQVLHYLQSTLHQLHSDKKTGGTMYQ